ncbi:response regulator [Flavobacterium sp. LS1R47]|uniref:Response regulator n=1 Tax=Flavobacterium frigoritolerans TaxID=2987686 RepID=A0A9X3CA88_9FLAO|nr:response regulator [Flavobacterium frigoritolerans]MCV9934453.1 response regulator [Flavobacterium frigoritolerans]
MRKDDKIKVFLVDDDLVFLKSLEIEFSYHKEFSIEMFSSGELCIENLIHKPDVVILDYHLDGVDKSAMNGLQTLDKIKEIDRGIPVIMLSSHDKIDIAVSCMDHRAFDYVVKSETAFVRLQKAIEIIFRYQKIENELYQYKGKM